MNLQEIAERMEKLDNWSLEGNTIVKGFSFDNFMEALDFVNKVGKVAEEKGHHPNILIDYSLVRLVLTTHSVRELTEKDFEVAEEIDKI